MKTLLLASVLLSAACSDVEPVNALDAGVESSARTLRDAAPVVCWQIRSWTCENGRTYTNICVPYDGCSETFRCGRQLLGYCGPGAVQ